MEEPTGDKEFERLLKGCSSGHFRAVEYFSQDGSPMPNGVYSHRGWFLRECRDNRGAFVLDAEVHGKGQNPAGRRGGVIVSAEEGGGVRPGGETLGSWLERHVGIFARRYNADGMLQKILKGLGRHNEPEDYTVRYVVGNAFRGAYAGDGGERYGGASVTVEVDGLSSEALLRLAEMTARVFGQETVLVKDLNADRIYRLLI